MKYSIRINQLVLSEYDNIDMVDGAILDYIIFYCNSKNAKVEACRIDGGTWIKYDEIIKDMPLLRINSRQSLTPRIKKLCKTGLISSEVRRVRGMSRLFVKLTPKVDTLFVETDSPVRETLPPLLNTNITEV